MGSDDGYGQGLVREFITHLKDELFAYNTALKIYRLRLRTFFKFVRNPHAHRKISISEPQALALIAHSLQLLIDIQDLSEAGKRQEDPGDLRDQLTLNCELLLRLGRLHFTKLALAVAEQGGPMVPGPASSQAVWVTSGPPTETALSLVTLTGHRSGQSIHFPPGGPQLPSTAVTDGRGDVLVTDGHFSVYDAGPGWDRPVPGIVVAVGPATWLNDVCDEQYRHCRNEIIDPANGSHWAVPGPAATGAQYTFSWPPTGVISPDGSTAA